MHTEAEARGKILKHSPSPDERCPAVGRVLTALWNRGVEECVTNPNLFEADLAEVQIQAA